MIYSSIGDATPTLTVIVVPVTAVILRADPEAGSVERHADGAREVRGRHAAALVAVPGLPVPGLTGDHGREGEVRRDVGEVEGQ